MAGGSSTNVDTEMIKEWRSIVTLVVFVLTSEFFTSLATLNHPYLTSP